MQTPQSRGGSSGPQCHDPRVLVERELSGLGSSHWQRRHLGYFKPTLLSPLRKVTELVFYPLIRRCRQNLLPTQLSWGMKENTVRYKEKQQEKPTAPGALVGSHRGEHVLRANQGLLKPNCPLCPETALPVLHLDPAAPRSSFQLLM